jgi:predicted enzyme related to lactoylglutathione lyase
VHPTDDRPTAELYLLVDDIHATLAELDRKGVEIASPANDQGWGVVASIMLPSGAELALYEPRHPVAYDLPD